jgi:hypothetical protein
MIVRSPHWASSLKHSQCMMTTRCFYISSFPLRVPRKIPRPNHVSMLVRTFPSIISIHIPGLYHREQESRLWCNRSQRLCEIIPPGNRKIIKEYGARLGQDFVEYLLVVYTWHSDFLSLVAFDRERQPPQTNRTKTHTHLPVNDQPLLAMLN